MPRLFQAVSQQLDDGLLWNLLFTSAGCFKYRYSHYEQSNKLMSLRYRESEATQMQPHKADES